MKKRNRTKERLLKIILIFIILFYFFKIEVYSFFYDFHGIKDIIEKTNIDEYIKKITHQKEIDLLKVTNSINGKNVFEEFYFSKKSKNKFNEIKDIIKKDEKITFLEKTNKIHSKITYQFGNDKKSSLQKESLILFPGETIICDCLELLLDKVLVFKNKGADPHKTDAPSILTLSYENKKINEFEIKNNLISKIRIPKESQGKKLSISWNKNSSGVLFFNGIEQNQKELKTIFLTIKTENNDLINKIKKKYETKKMYINTNSYPIFHEYNQNIKAIESNEIPLNMGYTYHAEKFFKKKEEFLFHSSQSNFKDLLRINVYEPKTKNKQITHSNTLINIERNESILNIHYLINDAIKYTTHDLIRIDIFLDAQRNEYSLFKIIEKINKNDNLILILGNDFDIKKNLYTTRQTLAVVLPNQEKNIEFLQNKFNNNPVEQSLALDVLLHIIKDEKNEIKTKSSKNSVVLQTKHEDAFVFQDQKYFTNEKYEIPLEEMKFYQKIIQEKRQQYQIRDILFSFSKLKTAKIKLISQDEILNCFSQQKVKWWSLGYDSKNLNYIAELKYFSDVPVDSWEVSCLIYGEKFINQYKIEIQKDEKTLRKEQIGLGQFLLNPNSTLSFRNTLMFSNQTEFSFLYAFLSPKIKNNSRELIIWSHYFPTLLDHFMSCLHCNEKKE
jgi:hypothetical protein